MKKSYRLEGLDCAHCAARIEDAVRKIEGVSAVSVSFIAQRLSLEADDECFGEAEALMKKIVKKIEPDCVVM